MWLLVPLLVPPAEAESVREALPPPAGSERVDGGAFGTWLGELELRPEGTPVRTFDGRIAQREGMRVVEFPVVGGDLQQCADTAIRLRAEWLEETGGTISFHATSGDPMPWSRWQAGERPYEVDNRLQWRPGTAGGWEAYLQKVFLWAGTRSLRYDTTAVDDPRPGDVVVDPGSPGHAVVLLDVARRADEVWVVVGEGYMPAQDLHVELGPEGGWYPWDAEDGLALPHWTLPASGLRRW